MVADRLSAAFRADSPENLSDITFLGFNQDQSCFAVGTGSGFSIYDTNTCVQLHHEECGAVSYVEMLFSTSLVALVGNSTRCAASSSKRLTLWNTKERSEICHMCFDALIYAVKMNHRRLVVLLREEVHILDLRSMKRLHVIERGASPWLDPAVGSLCTAQDRGYLALPLTLAPVNMQMPNCAVHPSALAQGAGKLEVRIGLVSIVDTNTLQPVGTLLAHRSPVQALCLNMTGHLLATASAKASVVRVFSVPALEILCVFRRGTNPCRIFGLNFSRDSEYLCLAAASGTVHVFRSPEQVLGTLPSVPDVASPGVNKLRARSIASPQLRPISLGPGRGPQIDNELEKADEPEAEANNLDDLSEWNVVAERPERELELLSSGWSAGNTKDLGLKRDSLDVLEALSGASENVTKHARSILQLLPQSCRELVDAERAYATVHLREEEQPQMNSSHVSDTNSTKLANSKVLRADGISSSLLSAAGEALSPVLRALPGSGQVVFGGYVACANSRPCRVGGSRLEMVVATRRGCAYIYDWDLGAGGEGQLRVEHCIAPEPILAEWSLDELPQTPPAHRRVGAVVTPSPPDFMLPEAAIEGSSLLAEADSALLGGALDSGAEACDLRTAAA
mmetsp:Transcript_77590/g.146480  ORF Transcript_77590/g.146480 Transcript_77590/m.146480 type:complete len:623 (+) Transcript_77590:102-1970(+)